jgi:acetoin utilization deacetylase AcuC-like enzyme
MQSSNQEEKNSFLSQLRQSKVEVGYIDDKRCQLHRHCEYTHPECSDRVRAIFSGLQKSGLLDKLTRLNFDEDVTHYYSKSIEDFSSDQFSIDLLLRDVHCYIDTLYSIKDNSNCGLVADNDTSFSNGDNTLQSAITAMMCVKVAIDAILDQSNTLSRVFCNIRPPGHHACSTNPSGFCFINNVAFGVKYLFSLDDANINRVAIIDWDVHHGNGTENIFLNNPNVLYTSLHIKAPFYPGTGFEDVIGAYNREQKMHTNINVPLKEYTDPTIYTTHFNEVMEQVELFEPDFIFISCGFDAHKNDYLGKLFLNDENYKIMTQKVVEVAKKHSKGRVVSVLEGGYNLKALEEAGVCHVKGLIS